MTESIVPGVSEKPTRKPRATRNSRKGAGTPAAPAVPPAAKQILDDMMQKARVSATDVAQSPAAAPAGAIPPYPGAMVAPQVGTTTEEPLPSDPLVTQDLVQTLRSLRTLERSEIHARIAELHALCQAWSTAGTEGAADRLALMIAMTIHEQWRA
ncbi:hypothetical protein ACM75Z_30350 [Pseudomonas aeruginosa]